MGSLQGISLVSSTLRGDIANGEKWRKVGESLPYFDQAISAARVRGGDERQRHSENACGVILRMRFEAIPERSCRMFLFRGREDAWSAGRNGGTMADAKKLSRGKTKGKTGSSTERPLKAVRGKKACADGAEQLRRAADQWLGWNSDTIANALTDNAVNGDLTSAKALVSLAEGKKASPEEVKKWCGPSLAERLAAEPPWQEGKGGSREQGAVLE